MPVTEESQGIHIPDAVANQAADDDAHLANAEAAQAARKAAADQATNQTPPKAEPETVAPTAPQTPQTPTVEPPQPPAEKPATADQRIAELEEKLARSERRNNSLQGMIKAQKPEVWAEGEQLQHRIEDLEKRLAESEAKNSSDDPRFKYLDDDEKAVLKDEPESLELRVAKGMTEAAVAEERQKREDLERKFEDLKASFQTSPDNGQTAILDAIEKALPGGAALNEDPLFNRWLDLPDPRSSTGATYLERGKDCWKRGDINGIVSLMQEHLEEFPPEPGSDDVDPRVAAMVKPPKVKGQDTITVSEPDQWKESDIARFYEHQALRRLVNPDTGAPMTKEEEAAMEASINEAIASGNVLEGI